MTNKVLTEKLTKLGFEFTDPGVAAKGKFIVNIDFYPYVAYFDNKPNIEFTYWYQFMRFYNKHNH